MACKISCLIVSLHFHLLQLILIEKDNIRREGKYRSLFVGGEMLNDPELHAKLDEMGVHGKIMEYTVYFKASKLSTKL